MQSNMSELLTLAFAMMATGNRRHMHASNWQRAAALFIMIILGAAGGTAGAIITLRVDNAVMATRMNQNEKRIEEMSQNLRQHEVNGFIHKP